MQPLAPRPAVSEGWRLALHGVGEKPEGGIYTLPLEKRCIFRTREQRRTWLDPRRRTAVNKYAFGGFVPATFGLTDERKNVNIRGSSAWVVLDFDGLPVEPAALQVLSHLTGEWFTSYSQGVKPGLRARVVLELDRVLSYDKSQGLDEVTPVRAAASFAVVEALGLDPEELASGKIPVIDRLCWRPSQYFNVPCHDPSRPQDTLFVELDGPHVFSADKLLERGRKLVKAETSTYVLTPGTYPEVTKSDRESALEDLAGVCAVIEEHRGAGFGSFYPHGKRLAGRVELGQLTRDEVWDCITDAVEEALQLEAEETNTSFNEMLCAKRHEYFRDWLSKPYVHSGLVTPRLTFDR